MYLLDTGAGLVMFDAGYGMTTHMIENSIRSLGFEPSDIKYLLISHGHFDHFGSADVLRQRYGMKVCMSAVDWDNIDKNPDLALMRLGPCPDDPICKPDILLEDGQVLSLGTTAIRCVLSPGHTYGAMSFFFDVSDGRNTCRVGYLGGAGCFSMHGQYCKDNGLPEGKPYRMLETLKKLRKEPVDILLDNHPDKLGPLNLHRHGLTRQPGDWLRYLELVEQRVEEFIALGHAESFE
jgi:metallo-beta-lactamase class B